MSVRRVVLLTQEEPGSQAAVDLLTEWARHGLIQPFITYTDDHRAVYRGAREDGEPTSVFKILARQKLEVIRVAALAGSDSDQAAELAERTRTAVDRIKELAPGGLRVVEARIWAPCDPRPAGGWTAPEGLYSSTADANLVLVPEDRQTEGQVGIPLSRSDTRAYGSHVATETATALGMWSGMSEAPVDAMEGGVIGFGDPKVHLTRSFVRIAEIPAVSLAGAADHDGLLRVPPGCQEAPYPLEAIAYAQDPIGRLFDRELVRTASVSGPERVGMARFLRELGRGMISSLRYMFTISRDVFDALRDMAGRTMQEAVGRDSVLRVVWRGMPSEGGEVKEQELDPEKLIAELRRRRALEGGVRIDQTLWADVGKAVFSLADGGGMPDGVPPQKIEDRVAIVKEVGMIAPVHGAGLADSIRADSSEDAPATLLGRLGAHLRRAEWRSRREFDRLIEQSKDLLNVEQPAALTTAGVVVAGLVTLIIVGLLLLTGFVELVGITEMRRVFRVWLWALVTAVYLSGLVILSRDIAARFRTEYTPPEAEKATEGESGEEPEAEEGEESPSRAWKPPGERRDKDAVMEEGEKRPPSAWKLWWRKAKKWSSDSPNFNTVILLAALAGLIAAVSAALFSRFGGQVSPAAGSGVIDSAAGAVAGWLLARDDLAIGITAASIAYAVLLAFQLDRKPYRSVETFRQARMLFFFTVIYSAFGLVGMLARDEGWYGEGGPDGLGDLWVGLLLLVVFVFLLLLAMAFDAYRRDHKMRVKVSDIERGIAAAVDSQWAAEEAYEQFVGSAAAWAAVMWRPFGEFAPGEARRRDGFVSEVLKAEARPFLVTPLGAMSMRERMMKELAKPGWLGHRYQTAVEAYRRRRAVETGTEPGAIPMPDQDPREVHTLADEDRLKVSGRWRFMSDLVAGTYDRELSRALDALDHANAAEWVYQQEGTLEASETGGESLEQYLGAVVPRADSEASHVYFVTNALVEADRGYRPTLWWPSGLLDRPEEQPTQECHIRSLVNGDLAIMSVRHDLAGPYTPDNLFKTDSKGEKPPEVADSGGGEGPSL